MLSCEVIEFPLFSSVAFLKSLASTLGLLMSVLNKESCALDIFICSNCSRCILIESLLILGNALFLAILSILKTVQGPQS